MAEAMRALGVGPSITFKGRQYELSPFTYGMIAKLEVWVEEKVWLQVEKARRIGGPEAHAERVKAALELLASDQFKHGSEAFVKEVNTLEGQKFILYLQLLPKNPDITLQLVEDMCQEDFDMILAKSKLADNDPNSKTPATQQQGTPGAST